MKRNSSKNADNTARRRAGFTLVELVVVIAVLAILAGVGAVAYRGYIKKAQEAADLEKLDVIKTAACAYMQENGTDCKQIVVAPHYLSGEEHITIDVYPVDGAGYDKFRITRATGEPLNEGQQYASGFNQADFYEYLEGNTFELNSEKYRNCKTVTWTSATEKWIPVKK